MWTWYNSFIYLLAQNCIICIWKKKLNSTGMWLSRNEEPAWQTCWWICFTTVTQTQKQETISTHKFRDRENYSCGHRFTYHFFYIYWFYPAALSLPLIEFSVIYETAQKKPETSNKSLLIQIVVFDKNTIFSPELLFSIFFFKAEIIKNDQKCWRMTGNLKT